MAPYFSRDFLDAMVQSFDLSISGWGLDVFWESQLGDEHSAAVVDRFTMGHRRPPDLHDGPYIAICDRSASIAGWSSRIF